MLDCIRTQTSLILSKLDKARIVQKKEYDGSYVSEYNKLLCSNNSRIDTEREGSDVT